MQKRSIFLVFLIVFLALSFFPNVFAPNFGYESTSTGDFSIENYIVGTLFACSEVGTADSITAYMDAISHKVKCAIYDSSKNLLANGVTEERTISGSDTWQTFNFVGTKPTLSVASYYLVIWAESTAGSAYVHYADDNAYDIDYKSESYNSFPNPWGDTSQFTDTVCSIFCTYSTDGEGQEKTFGLSETCGISDSLEIGKEKASSLGDSCGVQSQTVIAKEKGSYFSETTLTETETGVAKEKLIVFSRIIGITSQMSFSKEIVITIFELFETCNIMDLLTIRKEKLIVLENPFTISSLLGITKEQKLSLVEIFETVLIHSQPFFSLPTEVKEGGASGLFGVPLPKIKGILSLSVALTIAVLCYLFLREQKEKKPKPRKHKDNLKPRKPKPTTKPRKHRR